MSAPATKDLSPAPVNTTALVASKSIASKVASISFNTSLFNAFNAFGRLIVTTRAVVLTGAGDKSFVTLLHEMQKSAAKNSPFLIIYN